MRDRRRLIAAAGAGLLAVVIIIGVLLYTRGPGLPRGAKGVKVTLLATGLSIRTSFAFGDGDVFEGDAGRLTNSDTPQDGGVFVLGRGGARRLRGSPGYVAGMQWHDTTLFISGGTITRPGKQTWHVFAWSRWDGTQFIERRVVYTPPPGFEGFNGLGFGADGRLYVGVDTGFTDHNDHGPPSTSPFVYDILSMDPDGADVRVFASGIRQPWQMAFPAGSSSPYVSVLGQDQAATDPPDLLLRAHRGDDYGFPVCNWTHGSPCSGDARPFKEFAQHTDIMGLAIIGNRLYMTSFYGSDAEGPGGVVDSMPIDGGPLTPVVTGFDAAVVGLAAHAGRLYVGEQSGRIFSVKP